MPNDPVLRYRSLLNKCTCRWTKLSLNSLGIRKRTKNTVSVILAFLIWLRHSLSLNSSNTGMLSTQALLHFHPNRFYFSSVFAFPTGEAIFIIFFFATVTTDNFRDIAGNGLTERFELKRLKNAFVSTKLLSFNFYPTNLKFFFNDSEFAVRSVGWLWSFLKIFFCLKVSHLRLQSLFPIAD